MLVVRSVSVYYFSQTGVRDSSQHLINHVLLHCTLLKFTDLSTMPGQIHCVFMIVEMEVLWCHVRFKMQLTGAEEMSFIREAFITTDPSTLPVVMGMICWAMFSGTVIVAGTDAKPGSVLNR